MSFLRKIAGAFVVMDEPGTEAPPPAPRSESDLSALEQETASMLAQLDQPESARAEGERAVPDGALEPTDVAPPDALTERTAEEVFREHGLTEGPNSALRILKLVAGLQMFPREQQLAMVRAMEAADDSWTEADVIADAERRQQLLQVHLEQLAQDRSERARAIAHEAAQTHKGGELVLQEIDRQIAELQRRRQQEVEATTAALALLEQQQRNIDGRELRARQSIAQVMQALSGLLAFFGPRGASDEPRSS